MKGSAKCRIWGGLARLWVTQGRRQCHHWIACILLPVQLFRNCASVAPLSRYSELFVESRRLWLTPPLFAPPPVRISRRSLASEKLGRSPVSFDKYWAPGLRQPSDQASRLGLWVFWKLAAIPSTSTIAVVIITQPVSWYSFYRPSEGGRLSRPRHCCKGAQPVPKAVYRSGCHDEHSHQQCDLNLGPLTP